MTTPQELAYWLQGFFEITDAKVLTTDQVKKIKNKVNSCFDKKTSYKGEPFDTDRFLKNNPTTFKYEVKPGFTSEPIC